VDVTGRQGDAPATWWLDVLAFGPLAQQLAAVQKGQAVGAVGRVSMRLYTPPEGEPREQWSLLADALVIASPPPAEPRQQPAAPPAGATRRAPRPTKPRAADLRAHMDAQAPIPDGFNDDIPF
jgi:single-stranded DNA-binding protein